MILVGTFRLEIWGEIEFIFLGCLIHEYGMSLYFLRSSFMHFNKFFFLPI